MTKKIIALLLALVMIVGVLPLTALADQGADDPQGQNVVEEQKDPEENKDPENQNGPEENKDPENKNGLEENKDPENKNGLEENKDPENQNGLEENKDPENQNGLDENKDPENQENSEERNVAPAVTKQTRAKINLLDGITTWAQSTGHSVSVRFTVLYVDSSFNIGYNYGSSESTTFICQYSRPHSDTAYNNHTIANSDIKAAADRASVDSGWKIIGWTKTASKNPNINSLTTSGSTACNKGDTINLVAKKATPVTYSYKVTHVYRTNGVVDGQKTVTVSNVASGTSVNASSITKDPVYNGNTYTYTSATPPSATITNNNTTFTLYYDRTVSTAPDAPTDSEVQTLLAKNAVKIDCVNTEITPAHDDKTYALIAGTYSIGEVQGDATNGYTCAVTVTNAAPYVTAYNGEIGVEHSLDPDTQGSKTITLEYKDGAWAVQAGSAPVTFTVKCTVDIPAVTGITKEVVTAAPTDVTVPTGVTYPTGSSVIVDNGTTSVTLLYKVTVTGDAGVAYSVSDEGATCITNNATGTIPEGGEVVLYFTKTFTNLTTGDNTASNTASIVDTNYTDSVDVTITVKPAKPTDDELQALLAGAVGVTCTNESAEHGSKTSKTYNLLPDSYTIGDVTSEGDDTFTCTITVDAEKYVEAYNTDVAPGHVLDDESPKTIELVYRDKVWVKVSGVAELSDDELIPPDIIFNVVCTTYKLTYDANGGTGAPTDTKAYSHGATVTLNTTHVPTHAMYADGDPVVFIGWTASKTSTIYTKTDTAPATITSVTFDDSNITVYAAWGVDHNNDNIADVLQRVTLTYDANGGTGAPSSQSGLPGSFPISATRPTRTQYVFMGWATESSATTASYQPGGTITITANTTLYAVWEADLNGNGVPDKNETTYTVTYTDGVIGTKVFDDQVYSGLLSGTKTPAFVGTPTRTGYVFAGWVPAVAETVTENVTYVATWQKVSSSGLDKVPKTGDTTIAMIGGLMLFALCGGTAVYVIDRKKNRA